MPPPAPRIGPRFPRLGAWGYRAAIPLTRRFAAHRGMFRLDDAFGQARAEHVREKIGRRQPVHLLGVATGGHDSGASLVEVDESGTVKLVSSHAEERLVGTKRYGGLPLVSLALAREDLAARRLGAADLDAALASFDYAHLFARGAESVLECLPGSLGLVHRRAYGESLPQLWGALSAPDRLGTPLGLKGRLPLVGMPHHGNHAAFSWAASPFARSGEATLVAVLDAQGDDCAISVFLARAGRLRRVFSNGSFWDSLGHLFGFLSSCYGGWPLGDAEGRWMAAAAYGDLDRRTNPYYRVLRRILHLGDKGALHVDRSLVNWHNRLEQKPFAPAMAELFGPPFDHEDLARPDVALSFDMTGPKGDDEDRVQKAAATQLVLEDGLLHVLEHWLDETSSSRLVLTGGVALNCSANLRVIEALRERRDRGRAKRLRFWLPPVPADDGAHIGAAFQLALRCGASPPGALPHAFHCGEEPSVAEIEAAAARRPGVTLEPLGDTSSDTECRVVAKRIADLLASGRILGLFQGRAEIGRRALGHRSLLANPCDPEVPARLNRQVKRREPFRPVAPMCTRREAARWFLLDDAASADDFDAYRWMGLAARARPETQARLPAAVHRDGTARVQIVPECEVLTHAILAALGERTGAEVAINTSLNREGPIAQTPDDAFDVFVRADGLDALVLVGSGGPSYLARRRIG